MDVKVTPAQVSSERHVVEFTKEELIAALTSHATANGVNVPEGSTSIFLADIRYDRYWAVKLIVDCTEPKAR